MEIVELFQYRPGLIVIYNEIPWQGGKCRSDRKSILDYLLEQENTDSEKNSLRPYSGEFTVNSLRRFRRAVDALFYTTRPRKIFNPIIEAWQNFHLSFSTFTLPARPAKVTNREITKRPWNNLLTTLRKSKGLKNYVWKAELQENNNIHFHMLSDLFLKHDELRNIWNNSLNAVGAIDKFYAKWGHYSPNSTDIHTVNNYLEAQNYLQKYVSKKTLNEAAQHWSDKEKELYRISKVWDCSTGLRGKKYYTAPPGNEEKDFIERELEAGNLRAIVKDYFTLLLPTRKKAQIAYPKSIYRQILTHYRSQPKQPICS